MSSPAASPRPMWNFYYTNQGFSTASLANLQLIIDNHFGRKMKMFISDQWEYKSVVTTKLNPMSLDVSKPGVASETNWDNTILFNYKYSEIEHLTQYIRYVVVNYLDADNLFYAVVDTCSLDLLNSSLTIGAAGGTTNGNLLSGITPLQVATTQIGGSPLSINTLLSQDGNNTNPFASIISFPLPEFAVFALKSALQQRISEGRTIVIPVKPITLTIILRRIVDEEVLLSRIFPEYKKFAGVYFKLDELGHTAVQSATATPCQIQERKRFINWELYRRQIHVLNNMPCTPFFHLTSQPASFGPCAYMSFLETLSCSPPDEYLECLTNAAGTYSNNVSTLIL